MRAPVPPGPKAYEVKTWFSVSLPILIVEGFYLLLTNVDIVVLQHFRSPDDVAVYYAAAKTLALITFVLFRRIRGGGDTASANITSPATTIG